MPNLLKIRWPKLRYVAVYWMDAHSPAATEVFTPETAIDLNKPIPIITPGWVLREDEHAITVAGEWCGDDEYRNVTIVSRPMITAIFKMNKPSFKSQHQSRPSSILSLPSDVQTPPGS